MTKKRIVFKNKFGDNLSGDLILPVDNNPVAYALFAHCFTCSKDVKAMTYLTTALNQEGFAVLKFDFTGLGSSKGNFADTNFSTNVLDLISASEFLEKEFKAPKLLVGHSLGGAAVLQAASCIESVKAIATIGAPAEPLHVSHLFKHKEEEINEKGEANVLLAGRKFTFKKQFLKDLLNTNLKDKISNLKKALLILHSPTDNTVGIENAAEIFAAAKHPKSFISLDNADHLLFNKEDALYAGQLIASWSKKYLNVDLKPVEPEKATTVSTRTESGGFQTEIKVHKHNLLADEPTNYGGTDTGPTPYDYLAVALGACTSMTLRMYADHKKIPLESATVELIHSKVHFDDCSKYESSNKKIDQFTRKLTLVGNLTQQQKKRMVEIADKCPVHKTLHSEVSIKTELLN